MNAHTPPPQADETANGALAVLATANPVALFTDPDQFGAFYKKVQEEVAGHTPDLSTAAGRKAIASLAFKVTKTKTALDEHRKALTEEKRAEIAKVDAAGKAMRDQLDALAKEVRKPLTDWEEEDAARAARCQTVLDQLKAWAIIHLDDTSEAVAERVAQVQALVITPEEFADLYEFATDTRELTLQTLQAGVVRLEKDEADRAELARMRAEQEARDAAAAEAKAAEEKRLADEAAAKAEAEAKAKAEADAKAAADAAAQRAADEAREAEAKRQADQQAERDRQHQAQLDQQREATAKAQAEAQRLADEKAAADQEAAAEKAAADRRAADIEHRGAIMRAAKEALMEHASIPEAKAKAIVLAIAANSIPHVSIAF